MEEIEYQTIFDELSIYLKGEYKNNAEALKSNVFNVFRLTNNFCNERTAAYSSTFFLTNYFMKQSYEVSAINEASFDMKYSVKKERIEELKAEVDGKSTKVNKNFFCPDAVMCLSKDNTYRWFIEYKVHIKHFKFVELANDYLKYKLYTNNIDADSTFVYIVFNKHKDKMPYIESSSGGGVKIQFLNKKMTPTDVDKNANVFIYNNVNEKSQTKPNDDAQLPSKANNIVLKLDKIEKLLEDAIRNDDSFNYDEITDYTDNIYINNINCLGNKVATAEVIQKHFSKIYKLCGRVNITLERLLDSAKKVENSFTNIEEMIYWIKGYFPNLIKNAFEREFSSSNKALINGSKKRSLILLIMIKKYCELNFVDCDFDLNINEDEQKGLKDVEKSAFFKSQYKEEPHKSKYNLLIESILYFIKESYNIIFEQTPTKTDMELELVCSTKYSNYQLKKQILEIVHSIKRLFNKKASIQWNENLDEFGLSLIGYVQNIAL